MKLLAKSLDDSDDLQPGLAECVDHAGGEWRLRPDHGELDLLLLREGDQLRDRADRYVLHAVLGRGAAVAGCDEYFLHAWALRELPRQGMLAAAAADDEELHQ
jgi:hypothetical protein